MAPTLRPRNGNKDQKLSAKKLIGKNPREGSLIAGNNKKRVRIADDTLLDMARFFSRRELCAFKLVNRRVKRIVELGNRKKQFRQRFVLHKLYFPKSKFEYRKIKAVNLNARIVLGEVKQEADANEKGLLKTLKDQELDLVFSKRFPAHFLLVILPNEDIAEHLKLALPVRPKNVGELRLVRFWLRQLSRVHFEQTECNPDPYSTNVPCLNPAFVNALFPTEVIAVPSFGEVDVWLKEEMLPGLATFAQIDTLRCRLWKGPWYQEDYDPTTHFIDFILASKYRMNSVLIKSHRINGELTFTEELRLIEFLCGELDGEQVKRLPSRIAFDGVRNHGAELESWLEHSPLISNVEPHQFFTIDGFDTVTTEYDINGQNGAMKLQIVKKAVSVEYMAIEIHVIDKAAVEEFWRNMEVQVIDDDDDDDDDDAGDVIDGDDGARSHSI